MSWTIKLDPISYQIPFDEWKTGREVLLEQIKNEQNREVKRDKYERYFEKRDSFIELENEINRVVEQPHPLNDFKKYKISSSVLCYSLSAKDWSAYFFRPDENLTFLFGFLLTYGNRSKESISHELEMALLRTP